jgi:hypothetical protein
MRVGCPTFWQFFLVRFSTTGKSLQIFGNAANVVGVGSTQTRSGPPSPERSRFQMPLDFQNDF